MKLSKLIAVFITINVCSLSALADQKHSELAHKITDLGNGLYMETIPAKYGTFISSEKAPLPTEEWVRIPAVYETMTKTITVNEAYTSIDIKSAKFNSDHSLKALARAELIVIPAVTQDVTQRVIKTHAKWQKRIIPSLYHPPTIRKQINPAHYIIRNKENEIVQEFSDIRALADFLNTRE
ncbi:MAG: hypothetical protein COA43_14990 [Robiginitomaculum sp.]|nr:MAG: hypothetical protein COA43_14990 [Robiginitomaculum sp.]